MEQYIYFTESNGFVNSLKYREGLDVIENLEAFTGKSGLSNISVQTACGRNPTWDNETQTYVSDTSKVLKQEAEALYLEAREDTTVVWNEPQENPEDPIVSHTFRWHKPRHWEDWHRMLTIGHGIIWYDESYVPVPLTHNQMLEITGLIASKHQTAHAVYMTSVLAL